MPPEIADSDAESDLGSPIKQPAALVGEDAQIPQNTPSVIDFDQFLDPTQRLSSSASHQIISTDQLDGAGDHITRSRASGLSTDTRLTSVSAEMSPAVKSKKRAHSALQEGSKDSSHENTSNKSKSKRSKTYGAKSKSRLSQNEDLLSPPIPPTEPEANPTDESLHESERASAEPSLLTATSSNGHIGSTSLYSHSTDATPLMTTSMASMGHHQSINLDFRNGFDLNANPFGPLSQVSLDGDHIQTGINMLEPSEGQMLPPDADLLNLGLLKDQALPAMSYSSPSRPTTIDPAQLMQNEGSEEAYNNAEEHELAADLEIHNAEAPLLSMEKPPPKKRGRRPKNSRLASKSPAPSLGEDAEELTFPALPPSTRSRQGTVDSVSNASDLSGPIASTRKRRRGKSNQIAEKAQAESSPVKLPTSEPNISDEAGVGQPKEMYNPRPSRSRSKTIVEEEPQRQPDTSSPVKEPRSELGSSEEATIGLQKENYKPKPSRSRSKKVADEDVPDLPLPEPEIDLRTPAKSITANAPEEDTPVVPSTKSSGKKGRKSKVKRAKTSAAALLKKADSMLSEGEEDVVWMDSKSARVKLDLPPDLKVLKKELDPPENEDDDDDENVQKPKRKNGSRITIEIPSNPDAKNSVTEPKKRGRKSKKAQQKSEEKVVDEEDEKEPSQEKDSRPALAKKSNNVRASAEDTSKDKNPKKTPTVSPLTSPEPEASSKAKSHDADLEDKENRPVTTPAKSKSTAPTSSGKGPTKHSPINPPSGNSGKKFLHRVGLSRRQHIPSLLRKVDRAKPPPKNVAIKQKELKVKRDDGEEGEYDPSKMRDKNGMLVEWEF